MNMNDAFPSKYLKAADLQGQEPSVTMDRVEMEPVGQKKEMKAILYFVGKEKGLVLNKTNANKIMDLAGTAITEEWHGVRVRLYATETQFAGDTVDCIRVKAVAKPLGMTKQVPAPKPPPPPVEHDERVYDDMGDDPIPF